MPKSDKRGRALEIMIEVLDREPEHRKVYLAAACAGDEQLLAEVEALLAADRNAGPSLEVGLEHAAQSVLADLRSKLGAEDSSPGLRHGDRIGPWRIAGELGRGGMGVVYLAERADGEYEQVVALKVVKRGTDTDEVIRRFRGERQILARLQHPGIARLLDGGITDDGRPYFAMAHVSGAPITQHCDARHLSVDDRLLLFLSVCDAVQFAHRNLVVHRDLKPSNIFVTEDGRVQLLDFGIAKLMGVEGDSEAVTRGSSRVMTPEYAAPEQRRGDPVTTQTDVYSLGVVLHELLTGRRPAPTGEDESDGFTRPSDLIRRRPESGASEERDTTEECRARSTTPDRLRRRLSGDLDTMLLKALHHDPERRYTSAEAMKLDLQRHLAGIPVSARRDSWSYRAGRFMTRHKAGVAAAFMVAVVLLAGISATAWQARIAAQQAARATAATEFLVSLFRQASPEEARGQQLTAREILDRGVERIDAELADQPDLQGEMLGVVGDLYREIGHYNEAEPLLRRSLAQERAIHGREHLHIATALYRWGVLQWDLGRYDSADAVHRQALAMRERLVGRHDPTVSESLTSLANVATELGKYDEAVALHRRALAIDRQHFGRRHRRVASDLSNLAVALWNLDAVDEAEPLYREALAMRRQLLGGDHPDVAESLHALATFLSSTGRYAEAEPLFREALALRVTMYGAEHASVAITLDNFATLYTRMGEYDKAVELRRRLTGMQERLLGATHPDVAVARNNLAVLLYRMEKYDEAAENLEKALAIWSVEFGRDHPRTASAINNLGAILREKGDLEVAESLLTEALEIRRRILGDDHSAVAQSFNNLGILALRKRDLPGADTLFEQALQRSRAAYPERHPRVAEVLVGLGRVRILQKRLPEAEALLTEAVEIRRDRLGAEDWRTAEAAALLGIAYASHGRSTDAEPLLRSGRDGLSDRASAAADLRNTLRALVDVSVDLGKPQSANRYRAELSKLIP